MNILKMISIILAAAIMAEPFIIKKNKRKKQNFYWYEHTEAENNALPPHINWAEINDFLRDSEYGSNMPDNYWFMLNWAIQPCVKDGLNKKLLSKKSLCVLQSLSKDMEHLFYKVHFYYDHAVLETEDTAVKYKYVKELLETKYDGLSEEFRGIIYKQFVIIYGRRKSL